MRAAKGQFTEARRVVVLIASVLVAAIPAASAASPSREDPIHAALRRARLRRQEVGFVFLDRDGHAVFGQNAETLYIVASNNKIVTTAAALATLGPDFRWTTTLFTQGTVLGGTLRGSLWVHGDGDPNISGRAHDGDTLAIFRGWAAALRSRGIRQIEGGLCLDDSAFEGPAIHPSWPEKYWSAWFGAETSALSFSDNCVSVQISSPPQPKKTVGLSIYPVTSYVSLINNCVTAKRPRGPWGMRRHPEGNAIYVSGLVPTAKSPPAVWIPVHDPTLYFGTVLKETLLREGITVAGEVRRGTLPESGLAIVDRLSSGLAESLVITNKRSQNFYAEQILKTMGHRRHGVGSFATGIEPVAAFLESCIGIPRGSYGQADGSGLSRDDHFTPQQLARLLWTMGRTPEGDILRDSLPLAGVDGTLEHRMKDPALRGRVRAKTGFLAGVSGLSGYLETPSGASYAFSILVNAEGAEKPAMDGAEEAILREAIRRLP